MKAESNDFFRLDDIEDGSTLRRGKPATHAVYGQAQTINSATFQYINATQEVRKLRSPHAVDIFIGMNSYKEH